MRSSGAPSTGPRRPEVRHLARGGAYVRVAEPGWDDALGGAYARVRGGRWNPPDSFPVVYLCRTTPVARANVFRLLADQPYGPEDLQLATAPVLVATEVPPARHVDAVTARGLASIGLPTTYPLDSRGRTVGHEPCEAIGQAAWDAGEPGIACRSAAPTAPRRGEELAWFERDGAELTVESTAPFEQWFWQRP